MLIYSLLVYTLTIISKTRDLTEHSQLALFITLHKPQRKLSHYENTLQRWPVEGLERF